MAIARGAGTEIIRCHNFTAINGTQKLIIGEQHHIYTVLSIVTYCFTQVDPTDTIGVRLIGWEGHVGTTQYEPMLFKATLSPNETHVWNDKFSFNGYEGTTHSGQFGAGDAAADLAYQNYIADQGGSAVQSLEAIVADTDGNYTMIVTFIDQNNS